MKTATQFTADQFVPTEFHTAEDKAKFARTFAKFLFAGCPIEKFTKSFYNRLSLIRGHIAHYDRGGFYEVWFSTPEKRREFVSHWIVQPIYGSPEFTFSDVEIALRFWLIDNRISLYEIFDAQQAEVDAAEKVEKARQEAIVNRSSQKFIVYAKSENTNSFGLHGYRLCAEDGATWEVARTLCFPWTVGEVLSIRLDARGNPLFEGCELPRRIGTATEAGIKKVWGLAK